MEFTKDLRNSYKNLITSGADIHSDISVVVEGESFPCHKFVLAACSPFFRSLFRWNKQEDERSSVQLEDISSETFKLIYGFIYLHNNALNEENFLEVWKAADFLQIDFIVSACEKLAMETINERNCHRYFWHAKLIGRKVMEKILEYITFNFDQFKDSQCLMELDGNDLLTIVRDFNLKTNREEHVVDVILKWVSHSCNDNCFPWTKFSVDKVVPTTSHQAESVIDRLRAEYLVPLIKTSRLDSLRFDYLNYLFYHKLIAGNIRAREVIIKIWLHKFDSQSNYWPTFACHRKFSQTEDVILMPTWTKTFEVFSIHERKITRTINTSDLPKDSFFNLHKGKSYLCGYTDSNRNTLSMFVLVDRSWRNVAIVPLGDNKKQPLNELKAERQTLLSFSFGDRVYVVHTCSGEIFTWDPVISSDLRKLTSVPSETPVIHATVFTSFIVAISGDPNNPVWLNIYDIIKQEWQSTVIPLSISDQNILSFRKEDQLYLLTSRGELFVVDNVGGGVSVKHVTTFSNFNYTLIDALVYCEDLYLFVKVCTPRSLSLIHPQSVEFPELFHKVHVIGTQNPCTAIIPACLPTRAQGL